MKGTQLFTLEMFFVYSYAENVIWQIADQFKSYSFYSMTDHDLFMIVAWWHTKKVHQGWRKKTLAADWPPAELIRII